MKAPGQYILTLNGGSSSIKFALFTAAGAFSRVMEGAIDRIGSPNSAFTVKGPAGADKISQPVKALDHTAAIGILMGWIGEQAARFPLAGVGHRIVHGGPDYITPQLLTPAMLADLRALTSFDPQHLPEEIGLAEAMQRRFADLRQVACFDTAFHNDMPRLAKLTALPRKYEAQGLRRYGFHGLSYVFLMGELVRLEGTDVAKGRIILAHLGNGASLAAVRDGKPVDTSMSFTPASGVMMGTRTGDIDPGLASWLARTQKTSAAEFDHIVNFQSGLLGVSETSADMQVLLAAEATDGRAAEAVALFCYQVKKGIGAFAAALGGLDQLVFAGGIGEHAPIVRARICEGLAFLGIEIDGQRNSGNAAVISPANARVKVRVIATNEELVIARAVAGILFPGSST